MRCLAVLCLFLLADAVGAAVPGARPAAPDESRFCDAPPTPTLERQFAGGGALRFNLSAAAEDRKDAFFKDLARISGTADDPDAPSVVMQEISDQTMQMQAGAGLRIGIPNNHMDLALVIRNRTELATVLPGESADQRLWGDLSLRPDPLDPNGSASDMLGNGSATTEAGLALDRAFGVGQSAYRFDAGLKAQRVDLYQYDLPAAQAARTLFVDDDILNQRQGFNLNAGLAKSFGDLDMALKVANLFPRGNDDANTNLYRREAQASLATALDCRGATARFNLDWNAREGFDAVADQRYATAGMSLAPRHQRSRVDLGYRRDLIGNLGSTASLGFGFSPLDTFDLNIAGTKGQGDSYGVMARLGIRL